MPRPDPDRRSERSSTGDRREDRAGSARQRSPAPGGSGAPGGLSDRLLAISAEERPNKPKGAWLTENMKKYKEENGIVSDEEPTEEEIKNQVKLPSKHQIERKVFKEPITNWVTVEPSSSSVPWLSWSREGLPEEAPERPAIPPRVDISLVSYVQQFKEEKVWLTSGSTKVPDTKMVLRSNFDDNEEVYVIDGRGRESVIMRTTVKALKRSNPGERYGPRREDGREERGRGRYMDRERNRSMSTWSRRDIQRRSRSPRERRDDRDRSSAGERQDHHRPSTGERRDDRDMSSAGDRRDHHRSSIGEKRDSNRNYTREGRESERSSTGDKRSQQVQDMSRDKSSVDPNGPPPTNYKDWKVWNQMRKNLGLD